MLVEAGGVAVELEEAGDRVCAHVRKDGAFEPASLAIWAVLAREAAAAGLRMVDVGAYTGVYSIAAALLGCKVAAFEPMPVNFGRLVENLYDNRVWRQVTAFSMAAAEFDGRGELAFNPRVRLTSGASLVGADRGGALQPVDVVRLDTVLAGEAVHAIKIDAERAEPQVLAGARETLARCQPTLLIEVLDEEAKAAVLHTLPSYRVAAELDGRNWLLRPC